MDRDEILENIADAKEAAADLRKLGGSFAVQAAGMEQLVKDLERELAIVDGGA